jgi:streptogramin lyase
VTVVVTGWTCVAPTAASATPVNTTLGAVSTAVAGVGWVGSIAVDPSGRIWYTSTAGVSRVDSPGHVTTWSDPSLKAPLSLTAGPDGSMWWVNEYDDSGDQVGHSIGRISADGTLSTFRDNRICQPTHMILGPDGNLWFTSFGRHYGTCTSPLGQVGRITPSGVITSFTDASIVIPVGLTVGPDGAIWFTNGGTNSIGRITMDGAVSSFTDPSIDEPVVIATGSDGALWFANQGDDSMGRVTTSGTVTPLDLSAYGVDQIGDLAKGPDGNVWLGLFGYGIARITPAGQVATMALTGANAGEIVVPGADGTLLVSNGTDILRFQPGHVPFAPSGVTALRSAGAGALVRWQAPTSDGGLPITGYTVTASPGGQTCQWTSGPLQCSISTLDPSTAYTFTVQATNAVGSGPVSGPSTSLTTGASSGLPFGSFDRADGIGGAVRVSGWAIDEDSTSPVQVRVAVDGGPSFTTVLADGNRPDLDAVLGYGPDHGFQVSIAASAGTHTVCVGAVDSQQAILGTSLGCRTVTVRTGSPVGSVDGASAGPGTVHVSGWALDPDTGGSIYVAVYVDGKGVAWYPASTVRADIAAAFPGYGAAHGYDVTFSAGAGSHSVCVYGINTGPGANVALGCRSVTVPGGDPVGSLDGAVRSGSQLTVSGWALDPDTAASIPVAVYVEGRGIGWFTAGGTRGDIAAAYPGYGAAHGYSVTTPVLATDHHVCVYAINQGTGTTNTVLGCKTF